MSPSGLVEIIVKKALHMAKMMGKKVIGLVENMSYLECPDCGKHIEVFGTSTVDKIAEEENIDTVCKLPINPEISKLTETGKISEVETNYLKNITEKIETL